MGHNITKLGWLNYAILLINYYDHERLRFFSFLLAHVLFLINFQTTLSCPVSSILTRFLL